jgi:hypothetical protein
MVSRKSFICNQKNKRTRILKEISPKNIPPGSGIRKKFIPDPRGKKAPNPGSGTLVPRIFRAAYRKLRKAARRPLV